VTDCIFCKTLAKEIPARIVHEDETSLAFHNVNPQAPVHVLIILLCLRRGSRRSRRAGHRASAPRSSKTAFPARRPVIVRVGVRVQVDETGIVTAAETDSPGPSRLVPSGRQR